MTRDQFIRHVKGSQKEFRRFLVALCCGDSQAADDIAQESYVKAYLSCDKLSQTEKFNAWLFRIGYTTFVSDRRSEKQHADYGEASELAADTSADESFRYQELYAALNRLSAKERMSILLFYMENYPVKEIAVIQAISEEAVRQHLMRGRNHLRNILSQNK